MGHTWLVEAGGLWVGAGFFPPPLPYSASLFPLSLLPLPLSTLALALAPSLLLSLPPSVFLPFTLLATVFVFSLCLEALTSNYL